MESGLSLFTGTCCSLYPTDEKTSIAPLAACSVNLPSASVTVPAELPFTFTDTPANGALFSMRTVPLTVIFCWADEEREVLSNRRKSNSNFVLCNRHAIVLFDIAGNFDL